MKERPILFQGAMVRAILDGSKTQTRRLCKPMNAWVKQDCREVRHIDGKPFHFLIGAESPIGEVRSPYGNPGDCLWVRETFSPIYPQDPNYNAGQPIEYDYAATYKHGDRLGDALGIKKVWKPSIHMPRKASRIDLEIVAVRVERLQDCSYEDALAEGVPHYAATVENYVGDETPEQISRRLRWPQREYQNLWNEINGAGSWDANPWVWVVEFMRVSE